VDENEWEMIYVSAATGEGIQDMIFRVAERLKMLPPITVYESEVEEGEAFLSDLPGAGVKDTVIRRENDVFFVEGDWIYNLMGRINFDDYESLNYFQRVLQTSGVFEMLEERGCKDGDTVSIYEFEFDYVK
jgi:GTP-binding protein